MTLDTVIGIENYAINRTVHRLYVAETKGGCEVLLELTPNKPRRMAFCTHRGDADDIVMALLFAHGKGIV